MQAARSTGAHKRKGAAPVGRWRGEVKRTVLALAEALQVPAVLQPGGALLLALRGTAGPHHRLHAPRHPAVAGQVVCVAG